MLKAGEKALKEGKVDINKISELTKSTIVELKLEAVSGEIFDIL